MSFVAAVRRLPRSSPYWPVLTHRVLRRVLPGLAVSALGDGMSVVAVSWLALQLAPAGQGGRWVAVAVAAYTLPAAAGTIVFRRLMSGRGGAQLAGWNALLRAGALGAIPVAYLLGGLGLGLYVALLAVSSLLASWGSAGRYTLIAELLPADHHLAANAVMTAIAEFAGIAGPPLAGLLIAGAGPVAVIAADAVSFAVLAATYRFGVPPPGRAKPEPVRPTAKPEPVRPTAKPEPVRPTAKPDRVRPTAMSEPVPPPAEPGPATEEARPERAEAAPARAGGFRTIRQSRTLAGLLALTAGFFLLFGPVYVALPIHVAQDLHAPATVLGVYYTAFGIGAFAGGLVTGYLRRMPLWPTAVGVVIAFGVAMLPLGLAVPAGVALVSFAVAGSIWGPYMSTSMALYQRAAPAAQLSQVLAVNGAVSVLAAPLGTMLGGPMVTTLGARRTLLVCALGTIVVGLTAACVSAWRRAS